MQPLVHRIFIALFFSFLAYCAKAANASNEQQEDSERSQNLQDEVLNFPTNCPDCAAPADTKMKLTSKFIFIFYIYVTIFLIEPILICCFTKVNFSRM